MAQAILDFLQEKALFTAVLATFVTVIAYIHHPRWKTLVFSMPIPFSCTFLASGIPMNPTHITGLTAGTIYHWLVFLMVKRLGWPIGVGIGLGVAFFLGMAALLRPLHAAPYALVLAAGFALWLIAIWLYRPQHEPGNRSQVPWWFKFPTVFVISLVILALVRILGGAAAVFPYAGVFTSFEMRRSLRTLAGQYTINNIAFLLMFPLMWWLQQHTALSPVVVLLIGWGVVVPTIFCIYRFGFGRPDEPVPAGD